MFKIFSKSLKNSISFLISPKEWKTSYDTAKEYLSSDVLKNSEAEELANILARDKDEILKALPKDAEKAKQETVRMLATKKIIQEIAIDAKETGKKYLDEFGDNFENWTEEARKDIALKSTLLRDTVYFLKERINTIKEGTNSKIKPLNEFCSNCLISHPSSS